MNRAQAGVLLALVLVVAGPLAAVATGGHADAARADATQVEADHVEFRITVHEDGSARWTLTYTRVFESEEERERFEAFAADFNENDTETYRQFREMARDLAATGRNATDRGMAARNFTRSAHLGGDCVTTQDCGTVTMAFTWDAFAAPDDDRLVVGDVFSTGLYLSASQQLVFETGDGLAFAEAAPDDYTPSGGTLADSRSITYEGERSFSDGRPRVVLAPADRGATPTDADGPGAGDDSDTPDTTGTPADEDGPPLALIGGLLVLVAGAGAAFVWWSEDGAAALPFGGHDDDGAAAAEPEDAADEPAVPEEELLTDEDRVLKLLEDNGGRMKQVDIVDETGWSKSKVSMLLSDMEDDEQISKLRVGRENIISLAGHEPEAAGSPHDED